MKTVLQTITDSGLVYDAELECYTIVPSPFTQLCVYFTEEETQLLYLGCDEEGMYDIWETYSPTDTDNILRQFQELYQLAFPSDVQTLVSRGVSERQHLDFCNNHVGEERFSFGTL